MSSDDSNPLLECEKKTDYNEEGSLSGSDSETEPSDSPSLTPVAYDAKADTEEMKKMDSVTVYIAIDNIPPDKNWKQVKYLLGGIINSKKIVSIKFFPPMTSITPPFITFQNCIVTLSLNSYSMNDEVNYLLYKLNTYHWNYFNLYAYVVSFPNFHGQPHHNIAQQQMYNMYPVQNQGHPGSEYNKTHSPYGMQGWEFNEKNMNQYARNYGSLNSQSLPQYGNQPLTHPHPHSHSQQPTNPMVQPPMLTIPPGNIVRHAYNQNQYGSMSQRHPNSRKYYETTPHHMGDIGHIINNSHLPVGASSTLTEKKKNSILKLVTETSLKLEDLNILENSDNSVKNRKKLQQIFNEKIFRTQMTTRKMYQLQIENFPPYLQLETEIDQDDYDTSELPDNIKTITTDRIEKYPRIKWSVLKEFIKLKCLNYLNKQISTDDNNNNILKQEKHSINNNKESKKKLFSDNEISLVANELRLNDTSTTTKNFYVGIYEDHDELMKINLISKDPIKAEQTSELEQDNETKTEIKYLMGTFYKAVVGFHDKEFYKICIQAIDGQEYALGYKLKVSELPAYKMNEKDIETQKNKN